jgi:hypothetical protein
MINLPYVLVPQLHQALPEDIKFTKKQDDVEDPREFDYHYLLVISRYTIENPKKAATSDAPLKRQKTSSAEERLFYKAEDELFLRSADLAFSFKTIFRETMQDGSKKSIVGGGANAPETHYKLVYLIKWAEYERRLKELPGYLKGLQE